MAETSRGWTKVQTEVNEETHKRLMEEKLRRVIDGERNITVKVIIQEAIQERYGPK